MMLGISLTIASQKAQNLLSLPWSPLESTAEAILSKSISHWSQSWPWRMVQTDVFIFGSSLIILTFNFSCFRWNCIKYRKTVHVSKNNKTSLDPARWKSLASDIINFQPTGIEHSNFLLWSSARVRVLGFTANAVFFELSSNFVIQFTDCTFPTVKANESFNLKAENYGSFSFRIFGCVFETSPLYQHGAVKNFYSPRVSPKLSVV